MTRVTWALALLCGAALVAAGGCGDPDEQGPDDEVCDNGVDDDDDGDVDCDDSDCRGDPSCVGIGEVCGNGRDDDDDGDVDCDDSECVDDPDCEPLEEVCDNEVDDDDDGDVDCDDSDCVDDPACETPAEVCDNEVDDDDDGDVDCDDSDCVDDPYCIPPSEDCANETDDDGDTLVDCDDPDCDGDPACEPAVEICDNDADDDGDTDVDCDDADCAEDPACEGPVEICDNDADDDGDTYVDCDDADCAEDPACEGLVEICDNDTDDDDDGLADCMDPGCDFDAACPELCNGVDDDGDGRVDESPIDATLGDPCYEGPAGVAGIGQCDEGTVQCFGGHLLCIGWVAPLEDELCDGLDNDCDGAPVDEEVAAGCSTTIVPGDPSRIEFQTQVRDVDVHFNLDTTGSMGGALRTLQTTLSTTIVPGIRSMLPTSEFGVSTFDDFPFGGFGSGPDMPFILHERVTSNVPAVQASIDAIALHGGDDWYESGIESLYQIATGAGVGWPSGWGPERCDYWGDEDGDGETDCADPDCYAAPYCTEVPYELCSGGTDDDGDGYFDCDDPDCVGAWECSSGSCPSPVVPGLRSLTVAIIEPTAEQDAYSVSLAAGETLVVDVDASEAGSPLDPYLRLYDQATGAQLTSSDDFCGLDSHLEHTATADEDLYLTMRRYADSGTGWYAFHATLDGEELVASASTCTALEVGGDPRASGSFDPSVAVPLVLASGHYPIADAAACVADCTTTLGAALADWIEAFCSGPPGVATCGDGSIDAGEECDDGGTTSGDGCDWACRSEAGPGCGDRHIDAGEECDDGGTTSGDGCSDLCAIEPGCGNALMETGEACDDGNRADGDGCSSTCGLETVCGDGALVPGEQCDDGNLVDGDGCSSTCTVEPACGDGVLSAGEACDDGNLVDGDGCSSTCTATMDGVPAFDWAAGFDPGLGHGTLGGVGFRSTSLPVVVHITDAPSHDCADYTSYDPTLDPACAAETFTELNAIGARVIGVATSPGTDPTDLLNPLGMVMATDSVVPVCAFDGSDARVAGRCGAAQCCTGIDGAGVAPDGMGNCPLVFQITSSGTGLDTSIVNALDALTQFVRYELTVVARDDPSDSVDALCFVESIGIVDHMGPSGSCAVTPVPTDADGDGIDDTLVDATPRTRVTFEIDASATDVNDVDGDGDRTETCAGVGTYGLYLDVVAEGGTVVATRRVEVEIL